MFAPRKSNQSKIDTYRDIYSSGTEGRIELRSKLIQFGAGKTAGGKF